jgi:hypothetical protein
MNGEIAFRTQAHVCSQCFDEAFLDPNIIESPSGDRSAVPKSWLDTSFSAVSARSMPSPALRVDRIRLEYFATNEPPLRFSSTPAPRIMLGELTTGSPFDVGTFGFATNR